MLEEQVKLDQVLCEQERRVVGRDWCVRWNNQQLQIDKRHESLALPGKQVLVKQKRDGTLLVEHADELLDCRPVTRRPEPPRRPKPVIKNNKKWTPPATHPWKQGLPPLAAAAGGDTSAAAKGMTFSLRYNRRDFSSDDPPGNRLQSPDTMSKFAAKKTAPIDVLVIGDHPCAYLAAMLLKHKSDLRVVLALSPTDGNDDRLITINPAFFDLHPLLAGLKQKLNSTNIFGLQFLSDQAGTASEHRTKSAVACVARYSEVRDAMANIFDTQQIEALAAAPSSIVQIDEYGLTVEVGKHTLHAQAVVLSDESIADEKKLLGRPESWEAEVMHRFTLARCKSGRHLNLSARTLMPMSLDLRGKLCWGWLLPGDGEFQLVVEQPLSQASATSGTELLAHWVSVLKLHNILGLDFSVPPSAVQTSDRPLAGALAHEGVANRTLLIGPAGGFYSACGEEMYPSCWSALFAADVLKKALKEKHLQDALNPYRHKWRTTLGDYLRGPHQNLRFLLPLVYRNPAMTARIAEAILLSKSVVR